MYGDPCRACGFAWSGSVSEAVYTVAGLPSAYETLLSTATGKERHPDLAWTTGEYVCHVADNLRIWAERLMRVVGGGPPVVGGYNEMELARARNYPSISLPASLSSLKCSVSDWLSAVGQTPGTGTVLIHEERGEQTLADVVRSNAHDGFHHQWDISRTLENSL